MRMQYEYSLYRLYSMSRFDSNALCMRMQYSLYRLYTRRFAEKR